MNIKNLKIKIVFFTEDGEKEVAMEDVFRYQNRAGAGNIQFQNLDIEMLYGQNCGIPKDKSIVFKTYFKIYDGEIFLFSTSYLRGNSDDPNSLMFLSFDGWKELITTEMFDVSICLDEINDETEHIHRTINQIYPDDVINSKIHEKVRDILRSCGNQLREIEKNNEENADLVLGEKIATPALRFVTIGLETGFSNDGLKEWVLECIKEKTFNHSSCNVKIHDSITCMTCGQKMDVFVTPNEQI